MSTPATTTASLETHLEFDAKNIRRAVLGGVLLAPESAPLITTLVAASGQIKIPDVYESVGRLSDEGVSFTLDRSMQEVRGWGSSSVLRRDVESIDTDMSFGMLETKRKAYEVYHGLDLSGVQMSAAGEWKFTQPSQPVTKYWRAVALGADGQGASRFYMARVFGRVSLSENEDEQWNNSDDAPKMFGVTLAADEDDEAGGPYSEYLFGPGALAAAQRMGITVASA
ncbi:hypothetical protein EV383_4383 [Pseudonocardia sediminis]|uniref:Uncharacterized protein n=1 Tax=Pseudonocardia sediminis TaxID=1397368 RepID=A0A4Q7V4D0_PSEST|nr:hypothetical protein [Pseudonocardia sediminis]RZT87459.1 hypothetical protein EV383_4383 [Pseudonocardia sediminis]